MKKYQLGLLAPFFLMSLAAVSVRAATNNQDDSIKKDQASTDAPATTFTETETVQQTKKITPQEAQVMSSNAATIMRHVADARREIRSRNLGIAKDELNQAQSMVDVLRSQMPTLRIKDRLALAQKHLQFQDTENVKLDLVPIYGDLTYVEDLVPNKNVKSHLDKAKNAIQSGDKKTASQELRAADESVSYTEADLPLNET